MITTKSRKVLALSLAMTAGISVVVFAVIFTEEPITLFQGGLIDSSQPRIIVGSTAVTAGDIVIILTMVSAIFGISYGISNSIIKKA